LRVAVAVSGGRDSTALLHCTLRAARDQGIEVLLAEASHWEQHVRRQVSRWARSGLPVRLQVARLTGSPRRGDSVEAWARQGRYAALAQMAHDAACGVILLAHHRDDQAETVLLQAFRGGGPTGLAAMSRELKRDGLSWQRPWIDQPASAIAGYARRWRLSYVTDPSNHDTRYARGRLRRDVMPALRRSFPETDGALATVARHGQDIRQCLAALAHIDLAGATVDGDLDLNRWSMLDRPRRVNALRHWLSASRPGRAVPESLLNRVAGEALGATPGRWAWSDAWLHSHRGRLAIVESSVAQPSPLTRSTVDLSTPGRHRIEGWSGCLCVAPAEAGLPPERLRAAQCRARRGGEQFRLHRSGSDRSLKKQYQAAGVPPWQRSGPLVYDRETLLYAPGLGIDARACRSSSTGRADMLSLQWVPEEAVVG
jgi:tRNA(Ile)-lysidine synthase